MAQKSELDELALLIAALCHDLDHSGLTNSFYKNSKSDLASKYDDALLERHHADTAFSLLLHSETGILRNLTDEQTERFREIVFTCILGTDMAVHKDQLEYLKALSEKVKSGEVDVNNMSDSDQLNVFKALLHTADLYNPFKPFHVAKQWATRLQTEFNDQVELEKKLGIPFMDFMAASGPTALAKGEVGFISFVAKPWYETFTLVFPEIQVVVTLIDNNIALWKAEHKKLEEEEKAKEEAKE